jgi:transposase
MQNNAFSYAAYATFEIFEKQEIEPVIWPLFSPDLNLIKTVWDYLKDYYEEKYGHISNPLYARMRAWIQEAWEAIPEFYFHILLQGMP